MDEKKKYMPVKEYAEKKKISLSHVYYLINQGNLETKKIGTYTLVRA